MLPALVLLAVQAVDPATPPPSRYPQVEIRTDGKRLTVPRLRHGERYTLRLTNVSRRERQFVAPTFFRQAKLVPSRIAYVRDDAVAVRPGRSVELLLTAPTGRGGYVVRTDGRFGFGRRAILYVD